MTNRQWREYVYRITPHIYKLLGRQGALKIYLCSKKEFFNRIGQ